MVKVIRKMEPLITVVIPVYNRHSKIVTALQSVQAQTYQNWEAIVVDDGSY
jgi:glycosyltransferase involved in cell wall biosynthesis